MTDKAPDNSLPPDIADALDKLVDSHFASSRTDSASKVSILLSQIDASLGTPPTAPADLVQRTMNRLKNLPTSSGQAPTSLPFAGPKWWTRYVKEIGAMAVAASILLMVCVLGIQQARVSGNRVACAENMGSMANAFSTYATLNNQALPQVAKLHDANWLRDAGQNLTPLLNASLIRPANLMCPGLETAKPTGGYSYINLSGPVAYKWDQNHATMIFADRNPLFANPGTNNPQSNSLNHESHGTYLLRADGSATWETTPNVGPANDNIWTISHGGQMEISYAGTETSSSPADVFLSP